MAQFSGWRRAAPRGGRGLFAPATVLALAFFAASCARLPVPGDSEGLAILATDAEPARAIAEQLVRRLHPVPRVLYIERGAKNAEPLVAQLRSRPRAPLIAIGPQALRLAAQAPSRPVVFCQVYDYEERPKAGLARGVMPTPPIAKQLQAWKWVDPRLQRIALITGPRARTLPAEARAAAREAGLEIEHLEVHSDKELLYTVKRLSPEVQGVWIAPDHRVLSAAALREALAHSVRAGQSALAFSPELLEYGALLSIESEHRDVAEQVLAQLRRLGENGVRPVIPLTRARVEVNALAAHQLGLRVPEVMRGGDYVF